jgi:hypothetical protein
MAVIMDLELELIIYIHSRLVMPTQDLFG